MSIQPIPNRWREIDALFDRALQLDPSERDRFLANVCGSDEILTLEVRALLQADARASDFLGPAALAMAARVLSRALEDTACGETRAGEAAIDTSSA